MHWADPTTAELFELLIEAIKDLPVFLVVTSRPEMQPAWAARPHVTVQQLSGLDDRLATALIKQVAGGRELPSDVVERIIAHADNVPLFIEELTNTVLQKKRNDKGESSSPHGSLSADMVPRSLHSSLMARLDQLSAGKEVAQIGAVVGREFSFDMMQALTGFRPRLELAIAELTQSGIIVAHGQPPLATYTFKHALVQDAAYTSLLRERRKAIHLRLAQELEQEQAKDAAEPHLIARHFAEAGAPGTIHLLPAGRGACDRPLRAGRNGQPFSQCAHPNCPASEIAGQEPPGIAASIGGWKRVDRSPGLWQRRGA